MQSDKHKLGDIDIDVANRDAILAHIRHIGASRMFNGELVAHNTGIYPTPIPCNVKTNRASIDFVSAEARGYWKLDLLNVHLYNDVKSDQHLVSLLDEPDWSMLADRKSVERLVHLHNQWHTLGRMPEPVNSIPRLAMFLAVIRPAKKHLIGLPWAEVSKTIWDRDQTGYTFKKSHAIAYAHLVVINMNLLSRGELTHSAY